MDGPTVTVELCMIVFGIAGCWTNGLSVQWDCFRLGIKCSWNNGTVEEVVLMFCMFCNGYSKVFSWRRPKKTSPGFQNVSSWVTNLNKLKLVVLLMLILNLRIFCGTICLYLSVVAWKTHFFSWGKTPWTSATPKHAEKRSNRVKKRPQIVFLSKGQAALCAAIHHAQTYLPAVRVWRNTWQHV